MSENVQEYEAGRVKLEPLKVKDLPKFMRTLAPIYPYFEKNQIVEAFLAHMETFIEAVALGSGRSREWLDEQTPDVLADLMYEVIEVNFVFFTERILPRILPRIVAGNKALEHLARMIRTAGGENG